MLDEFVPPNASRTGTGCFSILTYKSFIQNSIEFRKIHASFKNSLKLHCHINFNFSRTKPKKKVDWKNSKNSIDLSPENATVVSPLTCIHSHSHSFTIFNIVYTYVYVHMYEMYTLNSAYNTLELLTSWIKVLLKVNS